MLILLFSVLNDEQRALVERIFHEHHIHFQRISFRHFIYLRYTLEMGYREIGELLNISEDAAKKRGQRLVKKLRKLYERR